ncbi:S24 family peptidase [Xenorhabdus sp. TH1]|uniref:XRE family transcriptional regulator n=1 Tax=Xenorhabdus sp. TH1 TaxID=3130166 RepID=UPI0030D21605
MHERIKQARLANKLTQAELAERLGVTPQSVQQWESSTEPRKARLTALASLLDVDVNWLLFGDTQNNDVNRRDSLEKTWLDITSWDSDTSSDNEEVYVPLLSDIELIPSSGKNISANFNSLRLRFSKATLRRIGAPSDGSSILCFPAKGNSMEPVIPDGATIGIDSLNKKIIDGKVYAIEQDGLKRLKCLYRRPSGKILIRSYNRNEYEDEIAGEDQVFIIGRMFWYSVLDY